MNRQDDSFDRSREGEERKGCGAGRGRSRTERSAGGGGRSSRLQDIVRWCAGTGKAAAESYDGVIVFDECHKAKNFVPGKERQSSKAAGAVI